MTQLETMTVAQLEVEHRRLLQTIRAVLDHVHDLHRDGQSLRQRNAVTADHAALLIEAHQTLHEEYERLYADLAVVHAALHRR